MAVSRTTFAARMTVRKMAEEERRLGEEWLEQQLADIDRLERTFGLRDDDGYSAEEAMLDGIFVPSDHDLYERV